MKIRLAPLLLILVFAPLLRAQAPCSRPQATLLAPANGATNVASPVDLQWNAVPGALGYEVWASADGDEPIELGETSETTFSVDVDPETQVEWYVLTVFSDCKSESAHFKFTSVSCPTAFSTLMTPADGATVVSSPVTFTWTPVEGAAGYRLYIAKGDEDFEVWDETDTTSSTVYLEPDTYYWGIETFFDTCESTISDVAKFTIPRAANCPTAGANLLTPADGSTGTTSVHFSWTPVAGAVHYQVWAALDDGEFDFIDETTGTSIDADLGTGHVSWVVISEFNGCDATLSRFGEFDIPFDPACDHDSPYLITPADEDEDVPLKVDFIWTPVANATSYRVWVFYGDDDPVILGTTTVPRLSATLVKAGEVTWLVETLFNGCPHDVSPSNTFTASSSAVCKPPAAPDVYVDSEVMSGEPYVFVWAPGLNTSSYEVQEATKGNFSDAITIPSVDIFEFFTHQVGVPTRYYYRVRSLSSCGLGRGPFSDVASIVVLPTNTTDAAASYGTQNVVIQRVHVAGGSVSQRFKATVDEPWLSVNPASGTLPPSGLDFTISADPKNLPVGSHQATLRLFTEAGAGFAAKHIDGTTPTNGNSVPISVNLVTPVTPNAGNPPIASSLIIPMLAHTTLSSGVSQSDVRIANLSAQTERYQLNFTPSGTDGTKVGQQVTIQVGAGETAALNDVLKNFFGYAAATDNVTGVLEIRPVTTGGTPAANAASVTIASSRTYTVESNGTNGTFVPALPLTQFISRSAAGKTAILNLQQIAESAKYHTSLGFVEASGEPATVQLVVYGAHGESLGSFTIDLKPGEQREIGDFFSSKGLQVTDGRIEATVTSATGKVTMYASVLDKGTNARVVITPDSAAASTRQVLPGIADFTNVYAKWRSELRLFNASASSASVTATFYPQGGTPHSATIQLAPSEVKVVDNVVQSLFSMQNAGGSVVVTSASSVTASARTYNQTDAGGYAQFIRGLTTADGTVSGGRALQVVQLEESDRFRTNLGLVEISGNPATVEISAITTDSKVAVKTQVPLAGNEFVQINRVLAKMGFPATYDARISIKVIGGNGRVSGYASMIDNRTQSPTYIPAQ